MCVETVPSACRVEKAAKLPGNDASSVERADGEHASCVAAETVTVTSIHCEQRAVQLPVMGAGRTGYDRTGEEKGVCRGEGAGLHWG